MPPKPTWTAEPWKVLNDSEMAPADVWIVPTTYHDHTDHAIAEMSAAYDCVPDAERIVACVNALAGMNPAALPQVVEALRAIATEAFDDLDVDDGLAEKSARALAKAALQALQQEDKP